jgi:hypothetical protein
MSHLLGRGCGAPDNDVTGSEASSSNSSSGRDALVAGGSVAPDVADASALVVDVDSRDFLVAAPLESVGALATPLLRETAVAAPLLSAAADVAPSNSAKSS